MTPAGGQPEKRGVDAFALLGIGVANAACLAAGLGLGWFLDDRLGTLPLLTMVGLAVGIVLAGFVTWSEIRKVLK